MKISRYAAVALATAFATGGAGANDVLARWTQLVDQPVEIDSCSITSATDSNMYCDGDPSGTRLYFDMDSMDPAMRQQAAASCFGYDILPECKVTLSGTLKAGYGSPVLYDARAQFGAAGAETQQVAMAAGGLQEGEYACYGSGSTVLAGLGFIVSGNQYTDLDRTVSGTYSSQGGEVSFEGGHLDGETGRDLTAAGAFTIGSMAVCEPW